MISNSLVLGCATYKIAQDMSNELRKGQPDMNEMQKFLIKSEAINKYMRYGYRKNNRYHYLKVA